MELVDVAATVKDSGVKDHTPRTEEAQKEAAEAKTQALQAIADLGGVFSYAYHSPYTHAETNVITGALASRFRVCGAGAVA